MDRKKEGRLCLLLIGDEVNKERLIELKGYLERMQDEGRIDEIAYLGNIRGKDAEKVFGADEYACEVVEGIAIGNKQILVAKLYYVMGLDWLAHLIKLETRFKLKTEKYICKQTEK